MILHSIFSNLPGQKMIFIFARHNSSSRKDQEYYLVLDFLFLFVLIVSISYLTWKGRRVPLFDDKLFLLEISVINQVHIALFDFEMEQPFFWHPYQFKWHTINCFCNWIEIIILRSVTEPQHVKISTFCNLIPMDYWYLSL